LAYHRDITSIVRNLLLVHDPSQSIHPYAWTLVFELFYYIAFATIFILARQRITIFILIFSLPPIYNLIFNQYDEMNVIFSIYNLYFVAGVLCASYLPLGQFKSDYRITFVLFVCFQLIPFWSDSKLLLLFFTVAFFIAYLTLNKNSAVLEKIGNASYSIYLFHALVLSIGKYLIANETLQFGVFFTLSLITGYIYYMYAEHYLTDLGKTLLKIPASNARGYFNRSTRKLVGNSVVPQLGLGETPSVVEQHQGVLG